MLLGDNADDKERAELAIELSSLCSNSHSAAVGDAYAWDKEKASPEKKRLREELDRMKIVSRAKVTQDRIYAMAYHPEPVSCVGLLRSQI